MKQLSRQTLYVLNINNNINTLLFKSLGLVRYFNVYECSGFAFDLKTFL